MELRKRAFGVSVGMVSGLFILLTTWLLLIIGSPGGTVSKLGVIFKGYSYSWGGALIGFLWAFVFGFVAGVLIAWFYGVCNRMFYKQKST